MKRGGPLARTRWAPSPRQSRPKPARRHTGPAANVVALVHSRSGMACEVCGMAMAEQQHHRRPRGMGGTRRTESNGAAALLDLCLRCHSHIESHRNWAIVRGLLLQQHQTPAATPVLLRHGWVLLTDDGDVTRSEDQ